MRATTSRQGQGQGRTGHERVQRQGALRERDETAHRALIDGRGKEAQGTGNAAATVVLVTARGRRPNLVTVDTDLKVVGKLAQFGSGMLQQVSEKLFGQFVDSLEAKLAEGRSPTVQDQPQPRRRRPQRRSPPRPHRVVAAPNWNRSTCSTGRWRRRRSTRSPGGRAGGGVADLAVRDGIARPHRRCCAGSTWPPSQWRWARLRAAGVVVRPAGQRLSSRRCAHWYR